MRHLRTTLCRRLGAILLGISLLPLVVPARAATEGTAFAGWLRAIQVQPAEVAPQDTAAFDAALSRASDVGAVTLGGFLSAFATAYEAEGGEDLGAFFDLPALPAQQVVDVLSSRPEPSGFRAIPPRTATLVASGNGLAGLTPGDGFSAVVRARTLGLLRLRVLVRPAAPALVRLVLPARLLCDAAPLGP